MGTRKILIILGIGIIILGIILGLVLQDVGCGICGGNDRLFPKITTVIQYIPTFSKPSESACSMMGCSAGTIIPIFVDIYLSGATLIFLGCFFRHK